MKKSVETRDRLETVKEVTSIILSATFHISITRSGPSIGQKGNACQTG